MTNILKALATALFSSTPKKEKPTNLVLRTGRTYGKLATAKDRKRLPQTTSTYLKDAIKTMGGYWGLRWSTCNDSRVCESCAAANNVALPTAEMRTRAFEIARACTNRDDGCRCMLTAQFEKP